MLAAAVDKVGERQNTWRAASADRCAEIVSKGDRGGSACLGKLEESILAVAASVAAVAAADMVLGHSATDAVLRNIRVQRDPVIVKVVGGRAQ